VIYIGIIVFELLSFCKHGFTVQRNFQFFSRGSRSMLECGGRRGNLSRCCNLIRPKLRYQQLVLLSSVGTPAGGGDGISFASCNTTRRLGFALHCSLLARATTAAHVDAAKRTAGKGKDGRAEKKTHNWDKPSPI
jgi:hypothetical protein